jgi:hypothetical protein
MSKGGGAGKVYFVLYLAVVLELLIIIVERDEAEQSLLLKQKETMKIVESILSQLQSGAGTEGINTRPQDEITIPPSGINIKDVMGADIKSYRKYAVDVGVTDISADLKRKEGESEKDYITRVKKLIELGNVQEIEYQVFYSSNQDPSNAPTFPTEEELKKQGIDFTKFQPGQTVTSSDGNTWEFKSVRKLKIDEDQTFNNLNLSNITAESINPIYPKSMIYANGPNFAPSGQPVDSVFFYSKDETLRRTGSAAGGDIKKRSFVVNFQPPSQAGWYKLRFASRTNRILGVRADANPQTIDDAATVNIGTVQLTVRDLQKVRKELVSKLEKFSLPTYESLAMDKNVDKFDESLRRSVDLAAREQDAAELISKIKLYGYIVKLLAPGQSINFAQNRGSIEFNIRVILPKPKVAKPTVSIPDYMACFDKAQHVFDVFISPYQSNSTVDGNVRDASGNIVARISAKSTGEVASVNGGEGAGRVYRATVDKNLEPGKYTVEVFHRLGGETSQPGKSDLDIFDGALTPESFNDIKNRLSYAQYGNKLTLNAIPKSGGKIKSNQFRLYLTTDNNPQMSPVEGLTISPESAILLTSNINKVSLRIAWVQPLTNKEFDIFPNQTVDVAQGRPKINPTDKQDNISQTGNRIRVQVKNIKIVKPLDGNTDVSKADVKVSAGKPTVEARLSGIVDVASEPVVDTDGDTYTVTFDLSVNLPRGTDMINGIVKVPLKAVATNKANGKSAADDKDISVTVKYEQQSQRRGGGGGGRPAGGGGGRPRGK